MPRKLISFLRLLKISSAQKRKLKKKKTFFKLPYWIFSEIKCVEDNPRCAAWGKEQAVPLLIKLNWILMLLCLVLNKTK